MKKSIYGLLLSMVFALSSSAQTIVNVPSDVPPGEGNLNTAIEQRINDLNSYTFKLEPFGLYILSGTITVPEGQHLRIIADEPGTTQATAPPQIVWTSSTAPNTQFNFNCFGDITMKNVWLAYMRISGEQVGSSLQIQDNASNAQRATFEGCIFDYAPAPQNGSGSIGITAENFVGKFKNCYFRNNTDVHFRYYGRAVSFPFGTSGWHTDSLSFVNCTFANMGYVLMQEGGEYSDFVWFNHCTFLNTMMFTLESSWWWWLSVTNSVYVNAYMFGDIISQRGGGQFPNGGAITIDSVSTFGFPVPFTEQQRHVLFAHNAYYIEDWLRNYMAGGNPYSDTAGVDYKPNPQPMMNQRTIDIFNDNVTWPYVSKANYYEGVNPGFLLAPTNIDRIKNFLLRKWTDNSDIGWAFDTASTANGTWPLGENLRYTNSMLRSAGMGGFPLGDLYHWDKTRYNQWVLQEAAENATIMDWLTNGRPDAVGELPGIPEKFELAQNYPNPFNPTTTINYSIPQSGHISLKVYTLLGEEVATLFEGEQRVGNYAATFDGATYSSGVYFYRLQAGSNSFTRKLVLMK